MNDKIHVHQHRGHCRATIIAHDHAATPRSHEVTEERVRASPKGPTPYSRQRSTHHGARTGGGSGIDMRAGERSVLAVLVFALLLTLPSTLAFQVSPAKYEMAYEPGATIEYQFTLKNPGSSPVTVGITLSGSLAPYATAPETVSAEPGAREPFIVRIAQPSTIEPPGRHELRVAMSELTGPGVGVGAVAELVPIVGLNVPYEGAYLEYAWHVQDGKQPLINTIMLSNLGQASTKLTPQLTLTRLGAGRAAGEQLSLVVGRPLSLAGMSTEKIVLDTPEEPLPPGAYALDLFIDATDQENDQEETRMIWLGTPTFTIASAELSRFAPGEIGRITLEARSDWNEPLDVIAVGSVSGTDATGNPRSWPLREESVRFAPGDSATIELLWESEGASYGDYALDVLLRTERSEGTITTTFTLDEREPVVPGVPVTDAVRSPVGIVVLVVLIIILLITLLLHVKKRRR